MNNVLQTIYQDNMTQLGGVLPRQRYDTQDNPLSVTDPRSHTTSYVYDDFGRKNQTISPDTLTTKYEYDEAGNLTKRVDANGTTINYTYDELNRLTAIDLPGTAEDVSFTYDSTSVTYGKGRLTGRTDPSGSYTFYYDAHGNLIKEEKTANSILYTIQYVYNDDNNLTSITYPNGRTVTYTLDQTGRITQVSTTLNGQPKTLASSITYLPYGRITGLTYGNSLSLVHDYDNQYRTDSILVNPVLDRTYGYDANGNVTSLDDNEAAGNEALETAGIYTYDQDANLLADILRDVPVSYEYDYNANTVSANNRTFIYDSSNQLVQVLDNSNLIAEYTYNGAGQRIKKWTPTETRIFHYDLRGHLIAETTQAGTMIAEYIYVGDQLLAMITKPGETEIVSYFHNDHLGTPQVLTNDSQSVVWKAAYTPFGGADILTQTVENPFRLPGQYYDSETGLHYNYFRYYDPTTGRYVTPDPIGLEGGINLFAYTANNPVTWVDPSGLEKLIFIPPGDPHYTAALNAPDVKGVLSIHAHGTPDYIIGMDGTHWDAKRLAEFIRKTIKASNWNLGVMKLESCRSGAGENSIAEQLAKELNRFVIGADERIFLNPLTNNYFDRPYPTWFTIRGYSVSKFWKPGNWVFFGPSGPMSWTMNER